MNAGVKLKSFKKKLSVSISYLQRYILLLSKSKTVGMVKNFNPRKPHSGSDFISATPTDTALYVLSQMVRLSA